MTRPGHTARDVAPEVPIRTPECQRTGQHALVFDGSCAYCGGRRRHAGEAAYANPRRHELPHGWPEDDVREIPAAVLLGMAAALHHSENVLRRPSDGCVGCRLIARLPVDLQAVVQADTLRRT